MPYIIIFFAIFNCSWLYAQVEYSDEYWEFVNQMDSCETAFEIYHQMTWCERLNLLKEMSKRKKYKEVNCSFLSPHIQEAIIAKTRHFTGTAGHVGYMQTKKEYKNDYKIWHQMLCCSRE